MKIYYVIFDKVEFKYVSQKIHWRRHHIWPLTLIFNGYKVLTLVMPMSKYQVKQNFSSKYAIQMYKFKLSKIQVNLIFFILRKWKLLSTNFFFKKIELWREYVITCIIRNILRKTTFTSVLYHINLKLAFLNDLIFQRNICNRCLCFLAHWRTADSLTFDILIYFIFMRRRNTSIKKPRSKHICCVSFTNTDHKIKLQWYWHSCYDIFNFNVIQKRRIPTLLIVFSMKSEANLLDKHLLWSQLNLNLDKYL